MGLLSGVASFDRRSLREVAESVREAVETFAGLTVFTWTLVSTVLLMMVVQSKRE